MYFFQTSGEVVQSLTDIKCALKNHGVLSNGVIDRNDSLSLKVCSLSSPKEFVLQINNGYDLQCMYYKKRYMINVLKHASFFARGFLHFARKKMQTLLNIFFIFQSIDSVRNIFKEIYYVIFHMCKASLFT